MKIITDFEKYHGTIQPSVVTIGTFDGVHKGHQAILKQVVDKARITDLPSVLITFWPHPRFVLNPSTNMKLLSTFDEKMRLIEEIGIDYVLKIPFTSDFSALTPLQFVQKILVEKVNTKHLFIGYNHRFGKNQEGDINYLKTTAQKNNFEVYEITRKDIDNVLISSTKIRHFIQHGEVEEAQNLLGRLYEFSGKVVHGNENGRKIGYPTANLVLLDKDKLLPKDGVYAIEAIVENKEYKGMLNIGYRPTIDEKKYTIEAHLFNFKNQIYEKYVTIKLIKFIRHEIKFSTLKALQAQLNNDKKIVLSI